MASRRIERLKLDKSYVEKFIKAGITTCRDLMDISVIQIMHIADVDLREAENIILTASTCVVRVATAADILRQKSLKTNFISTGIPYLDTAMKGGLIMGTLTEVCGPSGIGKTQFALSCCASALSAAAKRTPTPAIGSTNSSRRMAGGVVFIDTEARFSASRLRDIIKYREPDIYCSDTAVDAPHRMDDVLQLVAVRQPKSCQELFEEIQNLQDFVATSGISLVVVDSISALARKEGLREADKEKYLLQQASLLKQMAEVCRCSVLLTNQIIKAVHGVDRYLVFPPSGDTPAGPPPVTYENEGHGGTMDRNERHYTDWNIPSSNTNRRGTSGGIDSLGLGDDLYGDVIVDRTGTYRPALGPAWYHCITSRVVMNTAIQRDIVTGDVYRQIHLVKSPVAGNVSMAYDIQRDGIVVSSV